MNIGKAYKIWKEKKANSDLGKVKITSSGSFYMKSEDLFNDKSEVQRYVREINKSLKAFQKNSNKEKY